eukprot:2086793-Rhodomonas_salina.1
MFTKLLLKFGFIAANLDETLFAMINVAKGLYIIICLYVDDALVAENWASRFNEFTQYIQNKIEITNEGYLNWYLSVKWRFNVDASRVMANQVAYIEKVAKTFGVDPNSDKGPKTSMDERFHVKPEDMPEADEVDPTLRTKSKSLTGSLLFPAGWCRPDLTFSVSKVARFAARPTQAVIDAGMRILKYMVKTKHFGIQFSRNAADLFGFELNQLFAYCNASYGDDLIGRKSTIGYIIYMNGGPVTWKSKLTPTVEGSSTHSELAALGACVEDVCNLRTIMSTLGFEQKSPTPVYMDNESCIAICSNKRSTHNKPVDVRYQKIREQVRLMEIVL